MTERKDAPLPTAGLGRRSFINTAALVGLTAGVAADTPPTTPHAAQPTAHAPVCAPHMGTPFFAQARAALSPPARAPPFFN